MLKIRNFSSDAESLVNIAVNMAEELRFNYVGTEHLLLAVTATNHPIVEELKAKGITAQSLRSVLQDMVDNDESIRYNGLSEGEYITGEMFSAELESIIASVLSDVVMSGRIVNGFVLINKIISEKDCNAMKLILGFTNKVKPEGNIPGALLKYGKDLTALARKGKLEPIIGREFEIDRMINVLMRKNKCNPCLVGEAGTGKTALVEGLAQRIVNKEVPLKLQDKIIFTVNMSEIIAGTKFRGEFEDRFQKIIKAAMDSKNIILFFDEIHTIMGAGAGSEGSLDAANILKPALARGGIQMIGATTTSEYKKTIEKDSAFERRLQSIIVNEPSVDETIDILNGIKDVYQNFHGVTIEDDSLVACAKLSSRYITDKFLPDKAITVLDETAARVATNGKTKVTKYDVAVTIKLTTGINVDELTKNENKRLMNLENELNKTVIGQEEAVSVVAKALKRSRSGLKNPDRPIGSFFFVGPTGVGKTELGKNTAKYLNGTERSLIKLDMSEYMEKHSVAKLIGAPPGYVGYDEGGQLTDRIKRNPYSVVLFDEIEKAHPEVSDILLQILDEGVLTDSHGNKVSFKDAVIIITSNVGSNLVSNKKNSIGFGTTADKTVIQDNKSIIMSALKENFRPEFLNRLDSVVVFNPLGVDSCKIIASKMLNELKIRVSDLGIKVNFAESVVDAVVANGFDAKMGARNIKREIQTLLDDSIADEIVNGKLSEGDSVTISVKNGITSFRKAKAVKETVA